ncbi:hypothetical protein ACWEBX_16865 [Streptomyces sp. NPDC005070]
MLSPARILGATAAAVALAGGGFAAGRLTAPDASSTASQCTEPRDLLRRYADAINADQDLAKNRTNGRTYAHVILQNPDCFGAEERASAQTILDTIGQGAPQDSTDGLEECFAGATDGTLGNDC